MGRASNRKKNSIKRKNAMLYPIYKMFAFDYLCLYSIEFLFLTQTKHIDVSAVLFLDAFYLLFKTIVQIPAVVICDSLGRKRSVIFGNLALVIYLLLLIFAPNVGIILIGKVICALGFAIKTLSEGNLLYDSVATRGGDGLYAKIDTKGGSLYYFLDATLALIAGYLFVINNYLPIFIALICMITATIFSLGFKDVYKLEKTKENNALETFKSYGRDLKDTVKFILHSNRMKSLILFRITFYSLIRVMEVYKNDLLVSIGVPEEQFSMIYAILTFIAAGAISIREVIEKKFRNRTLTFIALFYISAVISIGVVTCNSTEQSIIPFVLVMYVIIRVLSTIWLILEGKYLKNFTNEVVRSKITFTYELIGCMVTAIVAFLGGKLIQFVTVPQAILLIGLLGFALLVLVLDYMRTRFGLKPKEYTKKDIEFSK